MLTLRAFDLTKVYICPCSEFLSFFPAITIEEFLHEFHYGQRRVVYGCLNRRRHFRHFRWFSSLKVLRPKWFLFFNNRRLLAITTDVLGSSKLEKIQNLVLNLLKQTVPRESTAPLNVYTSRISSTHSKVNHLLRHNKQYHISRKVPPNSYRLNGHRLKR